MEVGEMGEMGIERLRYYAYRSASLFAEPASLFAEPASLFTPPASLFTQPASQFAQPASLFSKPTSLRANIACAHPPHPTPHTPSPKDKPMNTPLTTPPSIAIFLPALEGGGAERAMLHLAQGFADRGIKTDLVLAQAEGAYLSQVPSSIRIVDLNAKSPVIVSKTLALRRYLQQEQPSILMSALDIFGAAVWAQRLANVPTRTVMCVQTNLSQQFRDHQPHTIGRIRPMMVRWFYPQANQIIAASRGVAEDVSRMTGIPSEKIRLIYNPVVTPEVLAKMAEPLAHPWFAPSEPPVILGVGRLVSQKDFFTLIKAFALLRQRRPARLMILGEGEDRPKLESLIHDLGLESEVALPGFAENPYAYMAQASVFALSSVFEGFGNVVAEAIAAGTPVVSTDCDSGPAEILANGRYGKLVPVGDAPALAEAIATTLEQPIDAAILKQRAQDFFLDRVVEQYLGVMGCGVCGGERREAEEDREDGEEHPIKIPLVPSPQSSLKT
nr:glycosyltransferase [Kovacikia minuta]